jgi:hypothetical protein
MGDYGKYFTTRCPDCKHRMIWRDCRVYGYKGRWQWSDMCCHRCKQNWQTRDELTLVGGLIHDVDRVAYNPPDETLWIED